jgi:hypothetical protein
MRDKKWLYVLVVVASLIALALPLRAADDEGSSLYKMFERLTSLYDKGSLQARRTYVRNQLIRLNHQLWKYEQDKRYLVLSLQRSQPDWDEIATAQSDLYQRISQLTARLDEFGAEMRTYEVTVTEDAAGQLSAVLILKRAVWLNKVGDITRRKAAGELPQVAKEGSEALQRLTEANKALARLIVKLES